MENKSKKKTINTVIYLLIAAMLIATVLVSVFTVISRRSAGNHTNGHETSDTTGTDTTRPVPNDTTAPITDSGDTDPTDSTEPDTSRETEKSSPSAVTEPADITVSTGIRYYVLPVEGSVSKAFEIDVPVYSMTMNDYRAHTGVDLVAAVGSDVVAVANGTICKIWNDPMMGKCVSIDHGDSIVSSYMNLSEELASGIEVGSTVTQGQQLGAVGESSLTEIAEEPHLHLEMKVNGELVDPIEYMGIEGLSEDYEG